MRSEPSFGVYLGLQPIDLGSTVLGHMQLPEFGAGANLMKYTIQQQQQ